MTGNEEAMPVFRQVKQYSELHSIKYFNPDGIAVFVIVENNSGFVLIALLDWGAAELNGQDIKSPPISPACLRISASLFISVLYGMLDAS
jgi:hypothetical protein